MGYYVLASAAEKLLAEGTLKMKSLPRAYGTIRGIIGGHRPGPSIPVQDATRAMKHAFGRWTAALDGGCAPPTQEHLTTVKNRRCIDSTEAVLIQDANCNRI